MTVNTEFKQTEIGPIPVDWEVVELGSISSVRISNVDKKTAVGQKPVMLCNYMNVYRENYITNKLDFMSSTASDDQIDKFSLQKDDVIITKDSETKEDIAQSTVVSEPLDNVICGYHLSIIRPHADISGTFLGKLFNIVEVRSQLVSKANGTTRFGLNVGTINELLIPKPPLPEQKKIAEVLSTVDDKIDSIEQEIDQTRTLKKGLMQKLLTGQLSVTGTPHTFKDSKLGPMPESWEVVKLGEHTSKVGSGITPRGGSEAYVDSGIKFIRSQNVLVGKLHYENIVFITDEQHCKMSATKLQVGDVLLNITGASIGRSAVVPSGFTEGNVNQHVCIIRTNNTMDSVYLSQLLNSSYGQNLIFRCQAGGNREGLNFQQIKSFGLMLPPLPEQEKIAEILDGVDDKLDVLEDKKEKYTTLKKGLMQKLLTGKIRVEA